MSSTLGKDRVITSILYVFSFLSLLLFSGEAAAKEAGHLDVYTSILELLHIDAKFSPLFSSLITFFICLALGLLFSRSVDRSLRNNVIAPEGRFNLRTMMEMVMSFLDDLTMEQCGKLYAKFFPLLTAIFLFIIASNISGLIPGFPPVTENFSANLVIGLTVFIFYNVAGISVHGVAYLKQFTGPFLALAPLFIVLETISHLARPLSLSFRLTANIYVDHLLLSIFSELVPLLAPSFLMFFGLLVAVIQGFVFTMLTGIYINMAISHDH